VVADLGRCDWDVWIAGAFPERVRAAIQRKLAGRRPRMQDIAAELHISSQTLQRRLQDVGYRFQQVLEEACHQLARHSLNNSLLELNETAYLHPLTGAEFNE